MEMKISGIITKYENKVSKKGNEYVVIELKQDISKYDYFSVMLDNSLTFNSEDLVDSNVDLILNYNPRFRSFKVVDVIIN